MSHHEKIKVLSSSISHMPLHAVFRDSGVAEKHGFELEVDVAKVPQRGKPTRTIGERAALLLSGEYQFLSGLHHEPYVYRARGDHRLTFLAQTQNHWDDRLICRPDIHDPNSSKGKESSPVRRLALSAICARRWRAPVSIFRKSNLSWPRATAKARTHASPWARPASIAFDATMSTPPTSICPSTFRQKNAA